MTTTKDVRKAGEHETWLFRDKGQWSTLSWRLGLFALFIVGIGLGVVGQKVYDWMHYNARDQVQLRQAYMNDLNMDNVQAFLVSAKGERLVLQLFNRSEVIQSVVGAELGDVTYHAVSSDLVLPVRSTDTPYSYVTMTFEADIVGTPSPSSEALLDLRLLYQNPKNQKIRRTKVHPWAYDDPAILTHDVMLMPFNVAQFPFLKVDDAKKIITIQPGTWRVSTPLKIPPGYRVKATSGVRLRLENGASIISYSPFDFIGSELQPIVVSATETGQGVAVFNAGARSFFKHVRFTGLSRPKDKYWALTGGVVFYQSDVTFQNCLFEENRAGDDFLNVFRSELSIIGSRFENILADAFDGDFVKGIVRDTDFVNIGNDGIDVSGSQLYIENVFLNHALDKAISAGEDSHLVMQNIRISNSEIGLTSKDSSTIRGDDIQMDNMRLGLAVFQKKPEYDSASVVIDHVVREDVDTFYLLESGSELEINHKKRKPTHKNVKKMLYGKEYGKSSK